MNWEIIKKAVDNGIDSLTDEEYAEYSKIKESMSPEEWQPIKKAVDGGIDALSDAEYESYNATKSKIGGVVDEMDAGAQFVDEQGNPIDEKQFKLLNEQMKAQTGDPIDLAEAWASYKGIPLEEAKLYTSALPNRTRAEIMNAGKQGAFEGAVASTADLLGGAGRGVSASIDALTGAEDFLTSLGRTKSSGGFGGTAETAENIARDPLTILGIGTGGLGSNIARGGAGLLGKLEPATRLGRTMQAGTGGLFGGLLDVGYESTRRDVTGEKDLSSMEALGMTALPALLTGGAGTFARDGIDPSQAMGFRTGSQITPVDKSVTMPDILNPRSMAEQTQLVEQIKEASAPKYFTSSEIEELPETTRMLPEIAKNDPLAIQKMNEYLQEIKLSESNKGNAPIYGQKINQYVKQGLDGINAKRSETGANMAGIEKASAQGLTLFPKSKVVESLNQALDGKGINVRLTKEGDQYVLSESGIGSIGDVAIKDALQFVANLPDAITGTAMRDLEKQLNQYLQKASVTRAKPDYTAEESALIDFKSKTREAVMESIEAQLGGNAKKQYTDLRKRYGKLAEAQDEFERRIGRETGDDMYARGLGYLSGSLKNTSDRGARGMLKTIKEETGLDLQKEIALFEGARQIAGLNKGSSGAEAIERGFRNAQGFSPMTTLQEFLLGSPSNTDLINRAMFKAQGLPYERSPLSTMQQGSILLGNIAPSAVSNPEFDREQGVSQATQDFFFGVRK